MDVDRNQLNNLLYQALETEIGGIQVYKAAIGCAVNSELKDEWTRYLEQTQEHERILREVFEALELDPETDSPGRRVVRHIGESLVMAMTMAANGGGTREDAQAVAAECVVHAETKDHLNWELIGKVADAISGDAGQILKDAYDLVEDEEDEHLYHTKGWTRELWIAALGMPAVLPPPEEVKHVETAIGAARAEQSRNKMVRRRPSKH